MLYQYRATVLNVVDGDTIDALVDLGFHLTMNMRFRLWGINAAEKHGATITEGLGSQAHLKLLIFGKPMTIHTLRDKADKYGRMLCVLFEQNATISVNQKMLDAKKAVPFMVTLTTDGKLPVI